MKPIHLLILVLSLGAVSVFAYSMTQRPLTDPERTPDRTLPTAHRMPDGSMMANSDGQMGMMNHSTMMVQSEQEFITLMIPHHQEAVATAKEVLARGGTTPAIRSLATAIITAQEKEIAVMTQWYETWYGTPYPGTTDYRPMMRDLSTLSSIALDRTFLEDMVMHHMGAIMMARSVQPYITHPEITTLSNNIITSQTAEIAEMETLLRTLPQ